MNLQSLNRVPFRLRWTLANMFGWGLGLMLGGLLLNWLGGILGLILASVLTAACVGLAQSLLIRHPCWLLMSALGGAAAVLPTSLASLTLLAGPLIGFFVVGAVYGGVFAAVQWITLRHSDEFGLWIVANVIAGGLCGCLTLNFNPLGLPLFCSIGPVAFGLLTGWVLRPLLPDLSD